MLVSLEYANCQGAAIVTYDNSRRAVARVWRQLVFNLKKKEEEDQRRRTNLGSKVMRSSVGLVSLEGGVGLGALWAGEVQETVHMSSLYHRANPL